MATKSNKNVKLNAKDRMQFLEWQRDLLEIDNQIREAGEKKAALNNKCLERLNAIAKGYKVNTADYVFDLKALEFRRK